MSKDTTNRPHDAYQARANDIARLMDVLQMELAKHAQAASTNAKCWGEAEEIGKVRSDLIDLVGFISGFDRQNIEDFLTEAE